ncbi:hypothetical protein [Candidatus Pristimantibacillus sp. PTI5]|uniref:hypothetical protein n=1 Tax=Candidatus Pristimantibacillus sp. PTI5 TaxID=3400422 RepID=UPI003B02DB6B
MNFKVILLITSIILLVSIVSVVYYKSNYKTLDEAIRETNIPIDEIFHNIDFKDHTIIFYGKEDVLSVGLIEKTHLGYRWSVGAGSKHFNEENLILTRMFSNLHPREIKLDEDLVSLSFGVIYEDALEKIRIKYKDQDLTEATIIETSKGRIWYSFSNTPVNYDPEVTRFYKDGKVKSEWY